MKTSKLLIATLFLIIAVSLVFAANEKTTNTSEKAEKNMTYGNCVSDGAQLKNTCYKLAKDTQSACKTQAANSTIAKDAVKTCRTEYKKSMNQCKNDFKSAKNECKKIKHNFLETIGSSTK